MSHIDSSQSRGFVVLINGVLRTARDGGYDACQDSYRYGSRSLAISNEMPRLTRYDIFLATIIDYRLRRGGVFLPYYIRVSAGLMGFAGLASKRPPPARAISAAYTGINSRLKYAASRGARRAAGASGSDAAKKKCQKLSEESLDVSLDGERVHGGRVPVHHLALLVHEELPEVPLDVVPEERLRPGDLLRLLHVLEQI